ncbi:GNAT family N-acetyltransferase [Sphingomicrobium sediminis]|uniref:GNAT family N-acetyltransferase n=1 Tax=Sphingomicrobium sediminis TaxID=2950949 RepID=A0A9X2EKG5_9SPHN|nr:GNAT family N-acetyltransferase [Sphingomicrobium sediminis]MCM8557269.1 GNAT family N-acetyltransferase [Sphingomicrobium sediminis]
MIRPALAADRDALRAIAEGTQMFLGDELDHFAAMLDAELESGAKPTLLVADHGNGPEAAAYWQPEAMAQGVANLLFIGTRPEARRSGHGAALLQAFEAEARKANRLAIIETASDAMFAPAWALYRGHGYSKEARIADYYDDGLDKLIFSKRL